MAKRKTISFITAIFWNNFLNLTKKLIVYRVTVFDNFFFKIFWCVFENFFFEKYVMIKRIQKCQLQEGVSHFKISATPLAICPNFTQFCLSQNFRPYTVQKWQVSTSPLNISLNVHRIYTKRIAVLLILKTYFFQVFHLKSSTILNPDAFSDWSFSIKKPQKGKLCKIGFQKCY